MADTYYVNTASTGSGDGTTTAIEGANAAWKTIAKVNAASPAAGDSILFNKGNEWREQLTVPTSGSDGSPITFGAYGDGADPIINGADLVSTWTEHTTTVTLGGGTNDATADNNLSETDPTTNYDLGATEGQHKIQWTNNNNDISEIQRWDITSIPDGVNITAATISQYCGIEVDTGGLIVELWTLQNTPGTTWAEDTSTWNTYDGSNAWTGGADGAVGDKDTKVATKTFAGADPVNAWYDWEFDAGGLTELESLLAGNQIDLLFYPTGTSQADRRYFYTKDQTTDTLKRPKLTITYEVTNVWKATLATEPSQVFFDGTRGTAVASAALCNGANKWFWEANVLYVYSTEDPDGAVVIEATVRDFCVYLRGPATDNRYDYITVENLHLKYADTQGMVIKYADFAIINSVTSEFNYGAGFYVGAADDVTLKYCTGNDSVDSHGVYLDGAEADGTKRPIVEYCEFFNNTLDAGIQLNGANVYQVLGPIIRYNKLYNNNDGILDLSSSGGEYYYNLIYENISSAIHLAYDTGYDSDHSVPSVNAKVYNNLVYCNCEDVYGVIVGAYSTGHLIKNNILERATGVYSLISIEANGTATCDYNCFYDSDLTAAFKWQGTDYNTLADWRTQSGGDANSIASDPLMIDPANGDFHLNPHSPCVNAGTSVSLTEDYEGLKIRHAPDIGAHENQANVLFFSWFLRDFLGVNK